MKYAVFFKHGDTELFLQSSGSLAGVKKDQANIRRWMGEMGGEVTHPSQSKYVITEDGKPVFERACIGAGARSWSPIQDKSPVKAPACQG